MSNTYLITDLEWSDPSLLMPMQFVLEFDTEDANTIPAFEDVAAKVKELYSNPLVSAVVKNVDIATFAPSYINPMKDNPNQADIDKFWEAIATRNNVFLTGGGGVGKSFLIEQLKLRYGSSVALTATTGIAACNIGGSTIYSWLGIGIGPRPEQSVEEFYSYMLEKRRGALENYLSRLSRVRILVIDEVSMLSDKLLNYVDHHLRQSIGKPDIPFGGITIVSSGDFLQLPPVSKGSDSIPWAFNSKAWKEADFKMIELKHSIRQNNDTFIKLLNRARYGQLTGSDDFNLQMRIGKPTEDSITRILPVNYQVDEWNKHMLACNAQPVEEFKAISFGPNAKSFANTMITPSLLEVAVGAKVMCTLNIGPVYNGSVGVVTDINTTDTLGDAYYPGYITVDFEDEGIVRLARKCIYEDEDTRETGFIQFPLKLAWAITAHKSQGTTLSKAYINLDKVFAPGQAYVALSRCRSIEGITLSAFTSSTVFADREAVAFYNENSGGLANM